MNRKPCPVDMSWAVKKTVYEAVVPAANDALDDTVHWDVYWAVEEAVDRAVVMAMRLATVRGSRAGPPHPNIDRFVNGVHRKIVS